MDCDAANNRFQAPAFWTSSSRARPTLERGQADRRPSGNLTTAGLSDLMHRVQAELPIAPTAPTGSPCNVYRPEAGESSTPAFHPLLLVHRIREPTAFLERANVSNVFLPKLRSLRRRRRGCSHL